MNVVKTASRRLGNYGECEMTVSVNEDATYNIQVKVSGQYGNDWPFEPDNHTALGPFAPALREIGEELGIPLPDPPEVGFA